MPYKHKEAFALMKYLCRTCKHSEIFWNSRDGVTPFGTLCPICKRPNMMHVGWRKDICKPDYLPYSYQGVWTDMPESLKPVMARLRIQSADGTDMEVPEDEREDLIQKVVESFEPGTPWLIRWP